MLNAIIQMSEDLIKMDVDTYNECKYTLKAYADGREHLTDFLNYLFATVEEKRPLLIEMKEGIAV